MKKMLEKIYKIAFVLSILLLGQAESAWSQCPTYPLCTNESYTLTADAGLTGYQWFKDGVAISSATAQTYVVTATGVYSWTASDVNNCAKQSCCTTTFNTGTNCPVTCPPTNYTICPNESYSLTADAGLTNYQWYKDGVAISSAISQSYTATAAGVYTWTANDSASCTKQSCCPTTIAASASCATPCPTNNCITIIIVKN